MAIPMAWHLRRTAYAKKFSGKRTHRIIEGVGDNLPQEAPQAFAEVVIGVDAY
jgi:hypothetical protein